MVEINKQQVELIAKSISGISVDRRHLQRDFLRVDAPKEQKLISYFICSIICHQTHNLVNKDLNLIGWQYIESVFSKLMKSNHQFLNFDFLVETSKKELVSALESFFPISETDPATALEEADARITLVKEAVITIKDKGYSSLESFFNTYANDKLRVKDVYQALSEIDAFRDPYRKKSTLFLKLLSQANLYQLDNYYDLEPMMDYHMQRLLLRTGCVEVTDIELAEKLRLKLVLDSDDLIRGTCISAIKEISKSSKQTLFDLDDIFWSIGRSCCKDLLKCIDKKCNKTPCTFTDLTDVKNHEECIFSGNCRGENDILLREYWEPQVKTDYY